MPKLLHRNPSYCKHKASGQAIVTIEGKDIYLGPHGTAASRAEYDRVIGEWLANGRRLPRPTGTAPADLRVVELVRDYWRHAKTYYKRASGNRGDLDALKGALVIIKRLYGHTPACDFGPKRLKAVREEMVRAGWSRSYVNAQCARLRRMFKWGVENELVPASVSHGLEAVAALRRGKTEARETEPVKPVPESLILPVLDHMARQVKAMVEVQMLTGMRPEEVCSIRTGDIDRESNPWVYTPRLHKTAHHGHDRTVFFGPKAQAIISPFLKLHPQAFIFSPEEAEAERREALHERRKQHGTSLSCGNTPGSNRLRRRPRRAPGGKYSVPSYRRAISRACDDAFPPPEHLARQRVPANGRKTKAKRWETPAEWKARLGEEKWAELLAWQDAHRWHPHQLRHTAGTILRERYGVEAAQVALGLATLKVAQIYAEKNVAAARRIAGEAG